MAAVRHLKLLAAYWEHPRRPLDGLHRCAKFGRNRCRSFDNMQLSIFAYLAWKRLFTPQNWCFSGISSPKWGEMSTKPPKGTSAGRSGSSDVLIKSRGNKKCDKEKEERHIFGLFGIAAKWPWHGCMQLFWYLYVHSVEDSTLMPIFDQFCFSFVFLVLPKIGPNRCT